MLGFNDLAEAVTLQYAGPYDFQIHAPAQGYNGPVIPGRDVMDVCIPYDDEFVSKVSGAIIDYDIKLTIIHTPVPMGTTEAIKSTLRDTHEVVYAPVLFNDKSPVEQTKFIGADTLPSIQDSMVHLSGLGYTVRPFSSSRLIELATEQLNLKFSLLEKWEHDAIVASANEGIPKEMLFEIMENKDV